MRGVLVGTIALIAVAAARPVMAAELGTKPPIYALPTPVATVPSWTGFYLRGSLGGRWADVDWNTTDIASGAIAPDPTTRHASFDRAAFRASLHAGYDWQFARLFVAGIEVDAGWADSRKTIPGLPGAEGGPFVVCGGSGCTIGPGDFTSVKEKWDASVRARVGCLFNPFLLIHASGGVVWLRVESRM